MRKFIAAVVAAFLFVHPASATGYRIDDVPDAGVVLPTDRVMIDHNAFGGTYNASALEFDTYFLSVAPGSNNQIVYNSGGAFAAGSPTTIKGILGLANVATSGAYSDLSGTPTIPAAQVNSDWNASSGVAQILNKPSLGSLAYSSSVNNSNWSGTALALANGGTGATTQAGAQSALALVPGTNVQAYSAELGAAAGLSTTGYVQRTGTATWSTASTIPYSSLTGTPTIPTNTSQLTNNSGFLTSSNNLSDLASASTARTNLGLGSLATQSGTFSGTSSGTNTGDQNVFNNIAVSGQTTVASASTSGTLTLTGSSGITLTTDNTGKGVTIQNTGSDLFYFGSGEDGNVTVSSGTTTLSRDMYYNNLTINGTGSISTGNYKIFVLGTLDLSAAPANAIQRNGYAGGAGGATGTAGTAGSTIFSGTINGTAAAGAGGAGGTTTGTAGTAGTTLATTNGGNAGASGAGGTGSSGSGGASAAGASVSNSTSILRYDNMFLRGAAAMSGGGAGAGGGGGGGDGTAGAGGGGGGTSAPVVAIFANTVYRTASTAAGAISAKGGAGGNGGTPASGNRGGGGGGSGAGGGYVYLFYRAATGATATGMIDVSGGSGGAGGNGTGTGTGGTGGTGGNAGTANVVNAVTGGISYASGPAGTAGGSASGTTGGTAGAGGTYQVSF